MFQDALKWKVKIVTKYWLLDSVRKGSWLSEGRYSAFFPDAAESLDEDVPGREEEGKGKEKEKDSEQQQEKNANNVVVENEKEEKRTKKKREKKRREKNRKEKRTLWGMLPSRDEDDGLWKKTLEELTPDEKWRALQRIQQIQNLIFDAGTGTNSQKHHAGGYARKDDSSAEE